MPFLRLQASCTPNFWYVDTSWCMLSSQCYTSQDTVGFRSVMKTSFCGRTLVVDIVRRRSPLSIHGPLKYRIYNLCHENIEAARIVTVTIVFGAFRTG